MQVLTPNPDLAALGDYVPGVCNIGPREVRRRRAFAVAGFLTAATLFVLMLVSGASPAIRFLILLPPTWAGTFSWLQARRRFCAAFAMAGIANFGDGDDSRQAVDDPAARLADRSATFRLARDAFLLALPVPVVAALLPI